MMLAIMLHLILKVKRMNTNNIQKLQDKLIDLRNRKMSFLDEFGIIEKYMNDIQENLISSQNHTEQFLNSDSMRYSKIYERYAERKVLINNLLDEHQEAMDKMRAEKKRIHNEFDSQIIACRKKIEDNQDKNDNEDTSETEES